MVGLVVVGIGFVEFLVFSWGLLQLDLRLLAPGDIWSGIWALWLQGARREPLDVTAALRVEPGIVPPRSAAIMLGSIGLAVVGALATTVLLRVDRWRSRSQLDVGPLSLKRAVRQRSWAKPRDLLHLQPRVRSRTGPIRRRSNRLLRVLLWERRTPEDAGGDSWNLGRFLGAELRSGRGMHALVLAMTGAGKTLRCCATAVIEHMGAQVAVSSKIDLLLQTVWSRRRLGLPFAVFAPFTDVSRFGLVPVCWSPLAACREWSEALLTARALHDADPSASAASSGSDGARFYNADAVQQLLPPLLHSAALSELGMADVLRWTRSGVNGLDEPRELLEEHGAWEAARLLAGVQEMDGRQRSLLMSSAAHLVAVYRHPAVQAIDRSGLDPGLLIRDRGTLYIVVPEHMQEEMAPLVGALLGELLRRCEARSHEVTDPGRLPLVKLVCDEAASLTPLQSLPKQLAVGRGHGVRWMLVYQSWAQVKARYGIEADTILNNTGVKLVMGPVHDRSTREELVAMLGEEPVATRSHTSRGWGSDSSVTRGQEYRPKLSTDDLARLDEGSALLVHGSDPRATVKLPFWWNWFNRRAKSPEVVVEAMEAKGGGERP
ncbi:TraM recognition domain-containing protein [Conexibacter sp. JD483]|uniref:type IV secretory system conjugative DNA transfer family protein n=1 Tax=unclassified Conexibacter TaxID=2627773 RepID=UPI00271CA9C9|nr:MULTISPECIES: TraM recognition domain-containing protein [unclassified Conexibacter]MDO8186472.1 TraM recognition domain-containing protein [Conexibacter sp. CPCC 205706]MDO8200041.1 TraM recognition domain-containing protein [Conexibacter sp. CPCC 205762]MDR9370883.1 TraM recognition domain-containing protein [Conexibacter sp. JD483]